MGSLITGIGYIGSRLAELLLDSGEEVVGLDNLFSTDAGVIDRLSGRSGFTFVRGDVTDDASVNRAFRAGPRIDTVYHLAAQASAHPDAAPVAYTETTNLTGPRVVLEQCLAAGAATFVFGSSIQVYGRRLAGQVHESLPYGPMGDVAHLSKIYVEKLMEMYSHTRGLRCVSARIGLVYGLSPVMKTDPRFMTAPNKFCLQAAMGGALRVDATGFYPTTLVHVDDAARALATLGRWERGRYSAVNVIGETASIADVARAVVDLVVQRGHEATIVTPNDAPQVPSCTFHSVLAGIGFTARTGLREGLGPVLDRFLSDSPPSPSPHSRTAQSEGAR